ncbi:MAG: hypothetical protein K2J60_12755 [Acetatifactor sp.]|nr:hypothetical protein [Acetatifactor sp.]
MKMNRAARFSCITNLFELFADLSSAGAKVRHALCKYLFYGDMELDAHMEGMTFGTDFIYSADKKYILVPIENDPDMMIAFCE